MLRSTLSRPSLLRSCRSTLRACHATPATLLLISQRQYSSSRDSQVAFSQVTDNIRPATELPSSQKPGSAEPSSHTPSTPQRAAHLLDIPCDAPPPQSQENARSSSDSSAQLPKVLGVEEVKEKLRSWTESAAATIRDRADRYTAVAATTFGQLGRELNKVTGYGEIESLKRQVAEQEQHIKAAREAARGAKTALEQAVQQRAKSQREVNDLLQRKSSWTDEDVGRFTALVRQDHLYEQSEACAKAKASRTEEEVEREFTELMRVILNRYHEEQVWSDKIRSASTYGSLTVLGLNVIVFILAIVIVEPWKRRRLAQTFEKKVEEVAVETIGTFETKYGELSKQLKDQNMLLREFMEAMSYSLQPSSADIALRDSQKEELGAVISVSPHHSFKILNMSHGQLWIVAAGATAAGAIGWLAGSGFRL